MSLDVCTIKSILTSFSLLIALLTVWWIDYLNHIKTCKNKPLDTTEDVCFSSTFSGVRDEHDE